VAFVDDEEEEEEAGSGRFISLVPDNYTRVEN
jgi:hypothetical protein